MSTCSGCFAEQRPGDLVDLSFDPGVHRAVFGLDAAAAPPDSGGGGKPHTRDSAPMSAAPPARPPRGRVFEIFRVEPYCHVCALAEAIEGNTRHRDEQVLV